MEQTKPSQSLPDNAYRELKPGEEYVPMMPADAKPKEVTPYSVTMGLLMAVLFSAAAAYLGLRIGQVFEAAIPIAIIAVGMGSVLGKKNMLGQNVIIQSIGASSGVIVAGAIFTLPALYILGLDAAFWQVFLSSLFGGLLGIVLLIPFRKYFVKEMHGKYPFPEATATTEVLVSGEKGGSQAKLLAVAGLVGGLYDFVVGTFGLWTESVSTRICEWGAVAADKFKVVFGLNTSAAVLGLGYIIGLKYAMIITAGSCLVWFVIVPVVGSLAEAVDSAAMLSLLGVTRADIVADPQSIFTAENLFAFIGKPIGIGGIAMAGIIGIIRQSKIIRQAVGLAVSEFGGGKSAAAAPERTQRDISIKRILTILIATLISVFVFFHFGLLDGWVQSVTRTPGGGVDTLTAGGRPFSGVQLRKAFGLNSTRFTLLYEDGAFSFDVLGYGHRVGMSQYGADAIARLGFDYRTILRFYYRGASIESMQTNFKRQSRTGNAPSPQAGESA